MDWMLCRHRVTWICYFWVDCPSDITAYFRGGISLQHLVTIIRASSQKGFEAWIILKSLLDSQQSIKRTAAFCSNLYWMASMAEMWILLKCHQHIEKILGKTLFLFFNTFDVISSAGHLKLDFSHRWFSRQSKLLQQSDQPLIEINCGDKHLLLYISGAFRQMLTLMVILSTLCKTFCCFC